MISSITASALIKRTLPTQTIACHQGRKYSYKGDLKNGLPHGFGTKIYSRDEYYTGEWANGKRHGKGDLFSPRGKDSGSWKEDKRTGRGTTIYPDGTQLTGYWENNIHLHE